MDKDKTLLFQVEKEIAQLILTKLEHFEITLERASQIAKFILAYLPENTTDEQVEQIIPSLDDEFTELAGVVHKHLSNYEEKYKNDAIKNVQELIKHKHFEQASSQVNDFINRKLNFK